MTLPFAPGMFDARVMSRGGSGILPLSGILSFIRDSGQKWDVQFVLGASSRTDPNS